MIMEVVAKESVSKRHIVFAALSTVSRLWRKALPFHLTALYFHSYRNRMPVDKRQLATKKQSAKITAKRKRSNDAISPLQLQKQQRAAAMFFKSAVTAS